MNSNRIRKEIYFKREYSIGHFQCAPKDWDTDGNIISTTEFFGASATTDIPVRFMHLEDDAISSFEWYTTDGSLQERMRLTQAGALGIGLTTPSNWVHLHTAD